MSVNAARGEVALAIGGYMARLCLTLGALAEIEATLGCKSLSELDVRLRSLSAADLVKVLGPLLRGAGEHEAAEALTEAPIAPGEAAKAVAEAFRLGLGA